MIVFAISSFFACNKDEEEKIVEGSNLEDYISLIAENDTIHSGDSTIVTATATGNELTYTWRTNNNAPIVNYPGYDNKVYFYADPCVGTGDTYVYCEIQAENKSEEKKEVITIIP